MNLKELKQALRLEYKMKSGGFFILELGDSRESYAKCTAFNITFSHAFSTTMFCTRCVVNGENKYFVDKIITISFIGDVKEFKSIGELVDHIQDSDVAFIHSY